MKSSENKNDGLTKINDFMKNWGGGVRTSPDRSVDTLSWSQCLGIEARNDSQNFDYPDSFEWSQEVRIIEVAL